MSLIIKNFGGIAPKISPTELPQDAAQIAHNCDLYSGTLKPMKVVSDFFSLNENEEITSFLDEDKVFKIEEPEKVTVSETKFLFDKQVLVIRYANVTKVNAEGESINEFAIAGKNLATIEDFNETGVRLKCFFDSSYKYFINFPETYTISGFVYRFYIIDADENVYDENGDIKPTDEINEEKYKVLPSNFNVNYSRKIPPGRVSLLRDNQVYGYFEVVDTSGASFSNNYAPTDDSGQAFVVFGQENVDFDIDLNYAISRRRSYFYVQTSVVERGVIDTIEGPPSDISEEVNLMAGEYPILNVPFIQGADKNNIYRSSNNRTGFALIDEIDDETFTDFEDLPEIRELPLFGNFPDVPIGEFLENSLVHPSQFGVAYVGKDIYFSDYNKFHVWPEEFKITMQDDIDFILLQGSSIIVFCGGSIFSFYGSSQFRMSRYLITDTVPLINKLSIVKAMGSHFFVSNDGLFQLGNRSVINVTKDFYSPVEWSELSPELMSCKYSDGAIYINLNQSSSELNNLKFDIAEGIKTITTFSSIDEDITSFSWKSKKFFFEKKEIFDFVKLQAKGKITLKITADGEEFDPIEVEPNVPCPLLCMKYAHEWEFEIISEYEVVSLEIFERVLIEMNQSVRISQFNNQALFSSWIKFPDAGVITGGILKSAKKHFPIVLEFYHEKRNLVHTEVVFDGVPFWLPKNLTPCNLWNVIIKTEDHSIDSLDLFPRSKQIITDTIKEYRTDPSIRPWIFKEYVSRRELNMSSIQVLSNGYPINVKIITENNNYDIEVLSSDCQRLPRIEPSKSFFIEVYEKDFHVEDIAISTSYIRLR